MYSALETNTPMSSYCRLEETVARAQERVQKIRSDVKKVADLITGFAESKKELLSKENMEKLFKIPDNM